MDEIDLTKQKVAFYMRHGKEYAPTGYLTTEGQDQVLESGRKLCDELMDYNGTIYITTSPKARAVQTGEILRDLISRNDVGLEVTLGINNSLDNGYLFENRHLGYNLDSLCENYYYTVAIFVAHSPELSDVVDEPLNNAEYVKRVFDR